MDLGFDCLVRTFKAVCSLRIRDWQSDSIESPVPLENLEMSERMGVIFSFIILADAHFSRPTPHNFVLAVAFTYCH